MEIQFYLSTRDISNSTAWQTSCDKFVRRILAEKFDPSTKLMGMCSKCEGMDFHVCVWEVASSLEVLWNTKITKKNSWRSVGSHILFASISLNNHNYLPSSLPSWYARRIHHTVCAIDYLCKCDWPFSHLLHTDTYK